MPREQAATYFDPAGPLVALRLADVREVSREEAQRLLEKKPTAALFLPLAKEPWDRFQRGSKTVEVRRDLIRYRTYDVGRLVILRRGYNGRDLLARIIDRRRAQGLRHLPPDWTRDADLEDTHAA